MGKLIYFHRDIIQSLFLSEGSLTLGTVQWANAIGVFLMEFADHNGREIVLDIIHIHDKGFLMIVEFKAIDVTKVAL